jgi:signal transduction histidine kinase
MDVSEAETGVMKLRLGPVPVADLVRAVLEIYEYPAEEKSMRFEVRVPEGLEVTADRIRMQQALANLVDNAVKYSPAGTMVAIRAEPREDGVAIYVEDQGPGIPPEDMPRIWERLFRGDRSRSERGLGLGLSLVKAIMQAHRGRAEAGNREGAGARFTLWLPGSGG